MVLVIAVWTRNPYPAAEIEKVTENQVALQGALADNWQKHPSEQILTFMDEAAAADLLSRFFINERSRLDPPACGWVTERCLTENRRLTGLTCQAYPEGTKAGDMLCRTAFRPDEFRFEARGDVLGFVLTGEGCFLTVWSQENKSWQVRSVADGLEVDLLGTLMKRSDSEDPPSAIAVRMVADRLTAKTSDNCP